MFPQMGWDQRYDFQGQDPLASPRPCRLMQELGDLDQLENLLRGATNPGALAEVDIDRARDLLGDDAARSLERMAELAKMLEEAGLIENKEGRLELTPQGHPPDRRERARATCSRSWPRTRSASTRSTAPASATSATYETKPYEFGDPFNLDIERTVRNAIAPQRRAARRCSSRPTTSRSSAPSTSRGRRPC